MNNPGLKKFEVHEIGMVKTAVFGPEISPTTHDFTSRYLLTRDWGGGFRESIGFCGLNPSTATHEVDDPTIRREIGFAQRLGFKRMLKVNAFAYRATDPRVIYGFRYPEDIIGPENDRIIKETAEQCEIFVLAWGNHGALHRRDRQVTSMLSHLGSKLQCFGLSKTGQPFHPLYLPGDMPLQPFFKDPGSICTK